MMSLRRVCTCTFLAGFLLCATAAQATVTRCVGSAQLLKEALQDWAASSDDIYEIHVVQGNYALANADFNQSFPDKHDSALRLRGGYAFNCASRQMLAANTVLDGNNVAGNGLTINANGNALIEGFTFQNFTKGVRLTDFADDGAATFEVRYVIAHGLSYPSGGFEGTFAVAGTVQTRFHDSLVYQSAASPTGAAVQFYAADLDDKVAAVANVTIANNTGTGLLISNSAEGSVIARNLIVWANSGGGIRTALYDDATTPVIDHSDYQSTSGLILTGAGNLSTDPKFLNAAGGDYTLQATSSATNAGAASVPGNYPDFDLAGNDRSIGSAVDMGAYETTADNLNNFTVTTTNDNGDDTNPLVGSLRAAIKGANAFPGASRVRFNVPGECPRTFTLATSMPDITTNVTIDGTTQPGWSSNKLVGAFNAHLCVYLNGNSSAPYGLRVPAFAGSGRLFAKGIIFTGFTDAAIRLEGGANHVIQGNQFGAVFLAHANTDAIHVTANSGAAAIGDAEDTAASNLIANAGSNGISLDNIAGHNSVSGNLIGVLFDGVGGGGNNTGIFISNSPSNSIESNTIGFNNSQGVVLSGSSSAYNVLMFNTVGANAQNGPAGNSGTGIAISGDAHDNQIGASLFSNYGGNVIANNGGPGVWILPTAGNGNRVLSNSMFANGWLDVDLENLPPLSNDAGDADVGANALQNYPVLIGVNRQVSGYLIEGMLDSLPSASYRLDFYSGPCSAFGAPRRGTQLQPLSYAIVITDATGHSRLSLPVTAAGPAPGVFLTATATDAAGNTSETGECMADDTIFRNGFD
jgi:hypothetical protein